MDLVFLLVVQSCINLTYKSFSFGKISEKRQSNEKETSHKGQQRGIFSMERRSHIYCKRIQKTSYSFKIHFFTPLREIEGPCVLFCERDSSGLDQLPKACLF